MNPKLGEDVQWVFIDNLTVQDDTLCVTSERGKTYQVDLKTKAVTQSDLAPSQAPDTPTQLHNIPEAVERAMAKGLLAKEYEVSFQVNPFWLSGDFNGNGNLDVAVLVKQRSTGKVGIAIIHGGMSKVAILGAGLVIGNGVLEQQALRLVSARRLAAARVELGRSISARNQNVSPPLLLASLI